jgi:NAD+ synthase
VRDYVGKNRFPGVVLGLSGGIDSAVVAAMAVDALGPEAVHCVMLPYRYTATDSLEDAKACAAALGCRYDVVPIEAPVAGFAGALEPLLAWSRT